MKKNILLLFRLPFFLRKKQQVKNNLEKEGLKGAVKSVRKITYDAEKKFGKIMKGKKKECYINTFNIINTLIIYNEKGNMIEWNSYNSDGSLDKKSTYEYNAKKNEITWSKHNPDGSLVDGKYVIKYDAKGNGIEKSDYNSDGSLRYKIDIEYDDQGNETEGNSYNPDGSLKYKVIVKSDKRGKEIERSKYNYKGNLKNKITYKYDAKGDRIEENRYKYDGSFLLKYVYKYKFDKQGNWIEKTKIRIYKFEIPKSITERKIVYY